MKAARTILTVTGLALLIYGLASAVTEGNHVWYSFFVLGFFLIFDFTDSKVNGDSNILRLARGEWKAFTYTYLAYVLFALIIDLVMGRWITDMWVYPHFDLFEEVVHVVIIGYPFAFFAVSVLYRTLLGFAQRLFHSTSQTQPVSGGFRKTLAWILLIGTILAMLIPPLNFALFNNAANYEVTTICMVMGSFSMAPLGYFLRRDSFLHDLLRPDWRAIGALLITVVVSALLHEVPNTYAWEWRYQNVPFTSVELFDVNIIILTFGWFFLTVLSISVNDYFLRRYIPNREYAKVQ